jgi:isopentenyl diphosphate isomerase/L-lactate dehydrogenase-like FMN-dependent dehydrogenase
MRTFSYRWRAPQEPITVEDYRKRARRALPDMVWAYFDYGAEDLITLHANRSAFGRYALRMRVLAGFDKPTLGTEIAGVPLSLPVLLAPTGVAGLAHWTGERAAAQQADAAGTVSVLSTSASYSIEEVAAATSHGQFFQLYPWANNAQGARALTESLMERAHRAGYRALFLTVDSPTAGNRERERRRGMGAPPVLTPGRIVNVARHPAWCYGLFRHRRVVPRHLVQPDRPVSAGRASVAAIMRQMTFLRPDLNWDDFAWVRSQWAGPLFVKGVLEPDDAARAVDLGADGVVVSNHGGRQLDGTVASLDALPAIAARVGGQAQILLDGGVRRGTDVIKALCLGAHAVCIGRPFLYGLAADGPPGIGRVIEILRDEMRRAMILMGVAGVRDLGGDWIVPADAPIGITSSSGDADVEFN